MNRFDGHEMTSRYLWAEHWRWREARGDMSIVRHADDPVIGVEHESDARHFPEAMRERSQAFSLSKRPEPLRGVLKELAELHGLDGHELSAGRCRCRPTDCPTRRASIAPRASGW